MRKLRLEQQLKSAIDNKELILYYQPIISLNNVKMIGMEALVRWNHPEDGLISPGEFIPIAEQNGDIIPLGKFVFLEACQRIKQLHSHGLSDLYVSVNLSLKQLQDKQLTTYVEKVLHDLQLKGQCLQLEINESIALSDDETVIRNLLSLKELGVRIAIDNFGKGYSSLGYFRTIDVDTLKIDRSFIFDVTSDDNVAQLTAAVISLAKTLDVDIIAEGVETMEHLNFLKQHQCEKVQGYLFSPPVPFDEVFTRVQNNTFPQIPKQ